MNNVPYGRILPWQKTLVVIDVIPVETGNKNRKKKILSVISSE